MTNELFEYAVNIRRKLHQYPEVGFELTKTVELVTKELEKAGLHYTHKYGKGSVVAELGQGDKLIALRADMDALPVEEKTGLPYASKIPGKMHACGHDSHTAVLLATAKFLKEKESELPCRIRFIFQPAEELADSGSDMMVKNGVMDGVHHIIGLHCENTIDTGYIGILAGDFMAACMPFNIIFHGKSSHAALPQFGKDANRMAVEAYTKLNQEVSELAGNRPYIWNVGRIEGGQAHNLVSDKCELEISFRFYDTNFAKEVEEKVTDICNEIADYYGGSVEISRILSSAPVHNDEVITKNFEVALNSAGIPTITAERKMYSEDFANYLKKAPGMIFLFGTRNEEDGCTAFFHRDDFKIDEDGMKYAISAFCNYIMKSVK